MSLWPHFLAHPVDVAVRVHTELILVLQNAHERRDFVYFGGWEREGVNRQTAL